MLYYPLQKLDLSTAACKKAVMLARHDICAASFHTRLDSVGGGVNDCLINAAGIAGKAEPLYEGEIPIGRLVTLDEEINLSDFISGVKKSLVKFYKKEFSCDAVFNIIYTAGRKNSRVKKIGIVGGSGMDIAKTAAGSGADTFFSGEGKYGMTLDLHENFDINIITAGHFETEAVVLPFIKQKILERFPGAKADCFIGANNV